MFTVRRVVTSRLRRLTSLGVTVLLVAGLTAGLSSVAVADVPSCTGNAIVCENQLPGTPQSVWDVSGAGDSSIQGFATQISVNLGQTEQFKINTDASAYTIDIYRLGYYQGNGARKVASVSPSASLPQSQPACATDPATEIYDCGTWGVSGSWSIPSDAVSGVYIALLTRTDTGGASQIPFIVRDDSSHAAVVYQTSDPSWEAYNTYGVSDFYQGLANGRAYKVSYNRPFATRGDNSGRDFLFSNEYPMLRFMEQNGYDMTYISGLDTDVNGGLLTNHQAFVSTGHDEYWSDGQRTNVEKARDAGVSLAFFSGNEVYWKTRWEASEDGNNTPNRTLVCYKDSWAGTQIDPLGPTSTWRDPRFGGNGKGPENALTGTMYMANFDDLPITVSSQEGKNRLWRGTALGSQTDGTSTALAAHTVGYESDEDLDNGFRPAGLIRLSTTTGATPQESQDFGKTVAAGTTTHHLTEYRAASGALVFGAGTIQWAWGVDADHDGTVSPVDTRIQQATVNVLADMGASATTLMATLTASVKSTDTLAPTAVITSPSSGSTIGNGSNVTVTGTATDAGGGVVAGVEVSTDGGSSWHPAVLSLSAGTYSFTYTGVLAGSGTTSIQARAVDDSANIQSPATTITASNGCPCSIFGNATPATPSVSDKSSVTLGTQFTAATSGYITGVRFYKGTSNTGTHVGTLYTAGGVALASTTFTGETASGWQSASFSSAVPITAGTGYVIAYTAPNGNYAGDAWYFDFFGHSGGVLSAAGAMSAPNGVFAGPNTFPNQSYQQTNYYIDAIYSPTDTTPVTITTTTPLAGSTSNPVNGAITATFSRDIDPSSLAVTVTTDSGAAVNGTTSYNASTRMATFAPAGTLATRTSFSASFAANASVAAVTTTPVTFTFSTAAADGVANSCPCSIFNDSTAPASGPSADAGVEVGTAFTSEANGLISGVRFYKAAANVGTHTVSLWDSSGNRLATATVTGESTQGWQQASFPTAVSITAGTTYTVSYHAPNGGYSADVGGLGSALNKAPLHTLPVGGRYAYSLTAAPTGLSSANYYVDPVFTWDPSVVPTVNSIDPAASSTSVPVGAAVTATFGVTVQSASPVVTVTPDSGSAVAGTTAVNASGTVVTFTPAVALAAGTHYTVAIAGAKSLAGTTMTPVSTGFTTSGPAVCPCTLSASATVPVAADSGDGSPITVGTQFTASVNGYVTGVRYYRAAANTGPHIGTLYSAAGASLASVTFTDGAAGWTTAALATPVAVTVGTSYVVAVFDPVGHYSAAAAFFPVPYVNAPLTGTAGLFTYGSTMTVPTSSYNNGFYYVDPVFTVSAGTAPATTSVLPASGAAASVLPTTITATLDQAVDPTSVTMTVTTAAGAAVAGATSYVAASQTAVFTPAAALAYGTSYTATVVARNTSGTAMATPYSWNFSTGPKLIAPTVTATNPAQSATATSLTGVTATFSQPMSTSSLIFTVATSSGTAVPGTLTWDATGQVATFSTAAKLAYGTSYTAKVSGANVQGTAMATTKSWSFVTPATLAIPSVGTLAPASGSTTTTLPTSITAKFAAAIDPATLVFGVTAGGAAVAGTTTYTASTATFTPTAALSWATTYTATVTASNTQGAPMISPKTWSFATPVQLPVPSLTATTPAAVPTTIPTKVTATFAAAIDATSLTVGVSASGVTVAGTTSYSSSTRVVTFTPTSAFAAATAYSVVVNAKNSQGAVMSPVNWTFSTPSVFTLFPATSTPAYGSYSDSTPSTVGTRFTSDKAGVITGVSFYDGPTNTATTVYLYSSTGAVLGTGSASSAVTGWRTVALSTPVPITAGTTYTAAYFAPQGNYALTLNGFGAGVNAVPLHAAGNAGAYRAFGGYPSGTNTSNYWVSPVLAVASGK